MKQTIIEIANYLRANEKKLIDKKDISLFINHFFYTNSCIYRCFTIWATSEVQREILGLINFKYWSHSVINQHFKEF